METMYLSQPDILAVLQRQSVMPPPKFLGTYFLLFVPEALPDLTPEARKAASLETQKYRESVYKAYAAEKGLMFRRLSLLEDQVGLAPLLPDVRAWFQEQQFPEASQKK